MTLSYRVINNGDFPHIECDGGIHHEDELIESIWLVQKELRHGLPKREQRDARRQIAHLQAMLDALRAG